MATQRWATGVVGSWRPRTRNYQRSPPFGLFSGARATMTSVAPGVRVWRLRVGPGAQPKLFLWLRKAQEAREGKRRSRQNIRQTCNNNAVYECCERWFCIFLGGVGAFANGTAEGGGGWVWMPCGLTSRISGLFLFSHRPLCIAARAFSVSVSRTSSSRCTWRLYSSITNPIRKSNGKDTGWTADPGWFWLCLCFTLCPARMIWHNYVSGVFVQCEIGATRWRSAVSEFSAEPFLEACGSYSAATLLRGMTTGGGLSSIEVLSALMESGWLRRRIIRRRSHPQTSDCAIVRQGQHQSTCDGCWRQVRSESKQRRVVESSANRRLVSRNGTGYGTA